VDKYAIVIHEEPEGGFWAEVPALPGCYSQGETMDELMENIREAISGVLEIMKANGTKPESNIQILDLVVSSPLPGWRLAACSKLTDGDWNVSKAAIISIPNPASARS
jgi:predicted RNase H-like HicB family nuclease